MRLMRRFGLSAMAMALVGALVGCGGAAAPAGGFGAATPSHGGAPSSTMAMEAAPPPASAGRSFGMDVSEASPPPLAAAPGASSTSSAPSADFGPKGGEAARSAPSPRAQVAPEPVDRPGLATQWGETRVSRITTVPFVRAEPNSPFAMASLFYNDEEGARSMANASGFRRLSPHAFTLAGGAVAVGLRAEHGSFLSGFVATEKNFVIGQPGQRYSIVLRNLTPNRIECVVSVDGLDVLDGQPAAFAKRGYLVDPHGELEIDGFRQSMETVAAFRFGSVRNSYANQKHGDTRNVGVIGVALFHERGTTPWSPGEIQRRQDANPFPGQFATPPGP